MSDAFLDALKSTAQERAFAESFDVDTSGYNEALSEVWTIRPMPGKSRDLLLALIQKAEYYRAVATSLVYRAHKPDGRKRFRPTDIDALMVDTQFLDWVSQEIRFQEEVESLLDPVAEGKKPSETDGSGE